MDKSKTEKRKRNDIHWIYIISCILISLIIAWTNVKFFEGELKEYDKKVFLKVKEVKNNLSEINNYMDEVEKIILEDDLVILYDLKDNKVIDSINVVVGEHFEEEVHKSILIDDKRIRLERDNVKINQYTYIHNINLATTDIFIHELENRYLLYYIPRWRVWNNFIIMRLLSAFSISCFCLAITVLLVDRQIKKFKRL